MLRLVLFFQVFQCASGAEWRQFLVFSSRDAILAVAAALRSNFMIEVSLAKLRAEQRPGNSAVHERERKLSSCT